jgi:hypothetical protein
MVIVGNDTVVGGVRLLTEILESHERGKKTGKEKRLYLFHHFIPVIYLVLIKIRFSSKIHLLSHNNGAICICTHNKCLSSTIHHICATFVYNTKMNTKSH